MYQCVSSLDYMFYSYVSMNYVLAHKQKANFTVEIVPAYGPRDNNEQEHWYTPAN